MSTTMRSKYHTPEYRRAYQALRKAQIAGEWMWCAQPICLMDSRWIKPTDPAHVGHDDSGTIILGPVHERCNTSDGATRGNRMRGAQRRSWVL